MDWFEIIGLISSIITIVIGVYNTPNVIRIIKDYIDSLVVKYKERNKIILKYRDKCRKRNSLYYKTDELIKTRVEDYYRRNFRPRVGLFAN